MGFIQLEPVEVVRNANYGGWKHPQYEAYWNENFKNSERLSDEDWVTMQDELGVTLHIVDLEDDADDELYARFFDEGDVTALIDWHPSQPYGDQSWFLVSIHENEDGASALWAKKK